MTQTATESDMSVGLGLLFTVLALVAALVTGASSFLNVMAHDPGLQLLSGLAMAAALVAGGLAIVATHAYHG